jgi:hypothetical protein
LVAELQGAIKRIRASLTTEPQNGSSSGADSTAIKTSIQAAIALILEEHQDWHMLVRPHRLPLG